MIEIPKHLLSSSPPLKGAVAKSADTPKNQSDSLDTAPQDELSLNSHLATAEPKAPDRLASTSGAADTLTDIAPTSLAPANSSAVPSTLLQEIHPLPQPSAEAHLTPLYASGELGAGFPSVSDPSDRSVVDKLQDWATNHDGLGIYSKVVSLLLNRISESTEESLGVNFSDLLSVEQRLYKSLAIESEGYKGGKQAVPIFKALADGQACYVSLGPERQSEADHMMLLYNNLGPEKLKTLKIEDPDLAKVRDYLVKKADSKQFPVFVDTDGDLDSTSSTESIATGCIISIAKRENSLGSDFPDPKQYYDWLLTRVESNYAKLDPWLFITDKKLHDKIVKVKENITPPWLQPKAKGLLKKKPADNQDPFGARPSVKQVQTAYRDFMDICGSGQPPTWNTLSQIADSVVNMDRDLVSGVQTYWIKMLSEISPEQRQSIMAPIAKAWVNLSVIGPDHQEFDRVSPPTSPKIDLIDRHSGKHQLEQYDRALALSQAVDHMINGLGLNERRQFLDLLLKEIGSKQSELENRENRLRESLGPSYSGLNVSALVQGKIDIRSPEVAKALEELRQAAAPELSSHQMTPQHAETIRHRDLMDWVATRYTRYGELGFEWVKQSDKAGEFKKHPLIISEYYTPDEYTQKTPVTPLPQVSAGSKGKSILLGEPVAGRDPLKVSMVFKGGGGRGFAYVEPLKELNKVFSKGPGQIEIDEFVGNSAGALTAGLLAAGYKNEEITQVLTDLDFKSFYSDYLWLAGGVDPKVRGINRSGLFSMQKMYQSISSLLQEKCGVEGRPVLFRDLPFKLKVSSTMLNGDISEDLREQLKLAPDGQVIFSDKATPNMDVAAAILASAAIPGFFNSPQLQVCSGLENDKPKLQRMQTVDGGAVNNFPIREASPEAKSFFMMLPVSYQAPPSKPGEKPISLSILNFDTANLAQVDAYNREKYKEFTPTLKETIMAGQDKGYQRLILGMSVAALDVQNAPVVQGPNRAETMDLLKLSQEHNLPVLDAHSGAEKVKGNLKSRPHSLVERLVLNELLDKDDVFKPAGPNPHFNPSTKEASGVGDVLAGVMAAYTTAPTQLGQRVFEAEPK